MKCPVCQVDLVMSERQSIEIDYCPKCRGVWLDRGELDKIIEKNAAEMAPVSAPQPARSYPQPQPGYDRGYEHRDRDYEHRGYKKPYRKKSLLEQIFD